MDSPVILVVDDEPLNLDIIEEFLTGKGEDYIVETANDGVEAMEKLEADPNKYDIVFKQSTEYKDTGYISSDSAGKSLVHLDPNAKRPAEYISDNQAKIYGEKKEGKKIPTKSTKKTAAKTTTN